MSEARTSSDDEPAGSRSDLESTSDLLERAKHGDRLALDCLFARHFPRLRRWAGGRLPGWARDITDTDDLVQDALLQTFRRIGGFEARGPGALDAYLRQAVLNRIKDELRRRGRRPEGVALDDLIKDDRPSPLELAVGREALERYEKALARLKPDEQEAIIGRLELGHTYEELAESLGKPTAEAARKAAQRALVKLVSEMDRLSSD
jgi:RNA polymerase sigma-70 factor, ECF subfamily